MTVATFASNSPDVSFRESPTPLIPPSFTPVSCIISVLHIHISRVFFWFGDAEIVFLQ